MDNNQKPPTQSVGVVGFKADLYASDEVKTQENINWQRIIALPKFQQFAIERSGQSYATVMQWIGDYVYAQINALGQDGFFRLYEIWHDEKGYWKNETPDGELI